MTNRLEMMYSDVLQAGGVHALGGDASRHSDSILARAAQQCGEGLAHHSGYATTGHLVHLYSGVLSLDPQHILVLLPQSISSDFMFSQG